MGGVGQERQNDKRSSPPPEPVEAGPPAGPPEPVELAPPPGPPEPITKGL